jgi:hypothetical protein
VDGNTKGKRNREEEGRTHHDNDRSERYGDVLIDNAARANAKRSGEDEILEAVVH